MRTPAQRFYCQTGARFAARATCEKVCRKANALSHTEHCKCVAVSAVSALLSDLMFGYAHVLLCTRYNYIYCIVLCLPIAVGIIPSDMPSAHRLTETNMRANTHRQFVADTQTKRASSSPHTLRHTTQSSLHIHTHTHSRSQVYNLMHSQTGIRTRTGQRKNSEPLSVGFHLPR